MELREFLHLNSSYINFKKYKFLYIQIASSTIEAFEEVQQCLLGMCISITEADAIH